MKHSCLPGMVGFTITNLLSQQNTNSKSISIHPYTIENYILQLSSRNRKPQQIKIQIPKDTYTKMPTFVKGGRHFVNLCLSVSSEPIPIKPHQCDFSNMS